MTRFSVLLLFLCLSIHGSSQYEEKVIEMPEKQNSLGLNFTPAAVVFMGGQNVISRFSIVYKRQTKVNFRWRGTVNYEVFKEYEDFTSEGQVIDFNDSTITYRFEDEVHNAWDIRAGMEWFKPDRMFSMIYGIDLFSGVLNENDSYDERTWSRDSIGFLPSPYIAPVIYEQEVKYGYVGFDLSIGQQIQAKENLFIVLRWTPQIAMAFPIAEEYSDPDLRKEAPSSRTTFRLRGIEVYAHWRF